MRVQRKLSYTVDDLPGIEVEITRVGHAYGTSGMFLVQITKNGDRIWDTRVFLPGITRAEPAAKAILSAFVAGIEHQRALEKTDCVRTPF